MRNSIVAVAAIALFTFSVAAYADTFDTFSLSAADGITPVFANGTLTLDANTDQFTSANLTVETVASNHQVTQITSQGASEGSYFVNLGDAFQDQVDLVLPVSGLSGYLGSSLCSLATATNCSSLSRLSSSVGGGTVDGGSLQLTSVTSSVTPEPSSIALLGTGLLGIAGVLRRRFV